MDALKGMGRPAEEYRVRGGRTHGPRRTRGVEAGLGNSVASAKGGSAAFPSKEACRIPTPVPCKAPPEADVARYGVIAYLNIQYFLYFGRQ
jgi:hypothetical protein